MQVRQLHRLSRLTCDVTNNVGFGCDNPKLRQDNSTHRHPLQQPLAMCGSIPVVDILDFKRWHGRRTFRWTIR